MKPTPEMNDLQSLHGQFSGFHSRILFLNRLRVFRIFMLFGIFCQFFGPMCLRLSVPQDTVLTLLVTNFDLEILTYSPKEILAS